MTGRELVLPLQSIPQAAQQQRAKLQLAPRLLHQRHWWPSYRSPELRLQWQLQLALREVRWANEFRELHRALCAPGGLDGWIAKQAIGQTIG